MPKHATETFVKSNETVNQGSTLTTFGDSITFGTSASSTSANWPNVLAGLKGMTLVNKGVSGARSNDGAVMDEIYKQIVGTGSSYTLMIGTNNSRANGTSMGHLDTFRGCLAAEVAWLAIPDQYKYRVNALSTTGTWTANSIIPVGSGTGYYTNTSGATITATITGTAVYVATDATAGGLGSFSVSIDGVSYGNYVMTEHTSVNTRQNDASPHSAYLLRFSGLNDGAHTVVITTNSTERVYIDWVAGNGFPRHANGPNVWLSNNIRASSTYYTNNSPHSEESVRLHNTMISEVAASLAADGLNVTFVDSLSALNNTTDLADGLHPNDTGYSKIADSFYAHMSSVVKPSDRGAGKAKNTSWIPLTLQNTWVNFSPSYPTPSYMKDANGFVHLKGVIKSGTVNTTTPMFILPEGYRPGQRKFISTVSNNALGVIEISNNGNVICYIGNTAYVSLDTVVFLAER